MSDTNNLLNNPILDQINTLPAMAAAIPPATLATKAKGYAISAAMGGVFSLLKWGYRKGTFKPTKYTMPIYAIFGIATAYYIFKYKKEVETVASNLQAGLTQAKQSASSAAQAAQTVVSNIAQVVPAVEQMEQKIEIKS